MKYPLITDWDGQSWCKFSICWPDSVGWRALLRGLITLPARGRTWDERTGLITSMTDIGKQIRDENLGLEHCIMSCNEAESLAAAIRYLADKLASRTGGDNCDTGNTNICGGGTGGAGNTEGPPTQEVSDTPTQTPPAGFADWAEYEVYKCSVAALIVNQAKSDTENAQLINWVGVVLSSALPGFIALLVSPMPGDEIMFIVGLCIAAIALGIPIFTGANQALAQGHDDYVCALISADNVGDAISNWENVTEEQIADQGLDPAVAYYVRAWLNSFANNDNFNRLFEKDTSINYPPEACPDCSDEYDISPIAPTTGPDTYPGGTYTSSTSPGTPSNNANVNTVITAPVDQVVTVNSITQTGMTVWQAQYRALNGVLVTSPEFAPGATPQSFNVLAGFNREFRIYANYQFVGSFQANLTADDL